MAERTAEMPTQVRDILCTAVLKKSYDMMYAYLESVLSSHDYRVATVVCSDSSRQQ